MAQPCSTDPYQAEGFLTATLENVGPCPARSDYLELRFSTSEGTWDWCFPEPSGPQRRRKLRPLALCLGTYGIQARLMRGDTVGLAVENAAALPMILAGAPVCVERRLVRKTRS